MASILFQRGATGWGFQVGRLYWQINFPSYWFLKGRMMDGSRRASLGHVGWETEDMR